MLSKIERGKLFPTLPTLLGIALVFGVGLEHFFTDSDERPSIAVTRKADRMRLPDRSGAKAPCYFFECLNFAVTNRSMEAYFAEFPVWSEPSEPHRHDGSELIYVIEGRLAVRIAEEDVTLESGDVLCFDSSVLHSYSRRGKSACRVIVITAALA